MLKLKLIFYHSFLKHCFLSVCLVFISACPAQKKEEPKQTIVVAPQNTRTPEQQAVFDRDKHLARAFLQADQIHREVLWVLMKDRPPLTKTIFGKLGRALQSDLGEKLKFKSSFKCDQYAVQKQAQGLGPYPVKMKFFEICGGLSGSPYAELEVLQKDRMNFFFESEKMGDVLGLGSSILNKRMTCSLELNANQTVQVIKCENLYHDRQDGEVFHLKKYLYQKDKDDLIEVSGEVLKNLVAQRKLQIKVPLTGKIHFSEKELQPTEEDLAREQAERQKAIEEAKNQSRDAKHKVNSADQPTAPNSVQDFVRDASPNKQTIRPDQPQQSPQNQQPRVTLGHQGKPILDETPEETTDENGEGGGEGDVPGMNPHEQPLQPGQVLPDQMQQQPLQNEQSEPIPAGKPER